MRKVGESAKSGARAKTIPGRVTRGDGKAQVQGGRSARSGAIGSANLKGNKNKGRTRSSSGPSAQSTGGRSKRTNRDLMMAATRDLVFARHAHPRRSPLG